MKRLFQILFLMFIFTSCSENFDFIDPTEFNKKISNRIDIETAKELIMIYYNYPENEGIPNLMVESKKTDNGYIEITLIHDGQKDDSVSGIKIIMIAELNNKKWNVIEIKTNRKCREGRGHTYWDTELCN